jgi:glycerol transport system ATP-binding protein
MSLSLKTIDKIVAREVHLKDICLDLESGSRNVILGRTLAGKTSMLRIMAGIDRPSRGQLLIDGENVTGRWVRKRSVAMVYQQFINYPSLTVYENIASPLKIAGFKKAEIDRRVHQIAEMLHIEELLDRLPGDLSGGQQQRTAIARALVKDADLLLLDEPLVNLDYKLREELRVELHQIFKQRKAIVVYTTTEPSEALMLGGNIVVIDEGRILQTGSTPEVYRNPAMLKVADIFSDPPINYLKGHIQDNIVHLGHDIAFPIGDHIKALPDGEYKFGVRAHHLSPLRKSEKDAEIKTSVRLSEISGSETFIHVLYDGSPIVVREAGITTRRIGDEISVYVDPGSFFIYDEAEKLVASPQLVTETTT